MMKYLPGFFFLFLYCSALHSQIITVSPPAPSADDFVTVIFDATKGNQALKDYPGPVYAHTGIITGTVDEPSGWKHVQGEWGKDDSRVKMKKTGVNKYQLSFRIRDFYQLSPHEDFLQMVFVFRNRNGAIVAKDESDKDIYYPEYGNTKQTFLERADGSDGKNMLNLNLFREFEDGSIYLSDGQQGMLIRAFENGICNIIYSPHTKDIRSFQSASVALSPMAFKEVVKRSRNEPYLIATYSPFKIMVHQAPIRLSFFRGDQELLRDEDGLFFDDSNKQLGSVVGSRMAMHHGEQFFGLGPISTGPNISGRRLFAYNSHPQTRTQDTETPSFTVPFFFSSEGYGIFIDNYKKGYFDFGKTNREVMEFGFKDSVLSWYFVPGNTPAEIIEKFNQLTGRQILPPLWALGYIQSRAGYQSQDEVDQMVSQTLAAGYPLDAIALDEAWYGGSDQHGTLDWEKQKWPDPWKLVTQLKNKGVHTILMNQPWFSIQSRHFEELDSLGLLSKNNLGESYIVNDLKTGPAALFDIFQATSGEWIWPYYQKQMAIGVSGWWYEADEPASQPKGMLHTNGYAETLHNLYGFTWARLLYEKHKQVYPKQRFFNLSSSGFAGIQKYSAFPRSGDIQRSWESLYAQIPIMLSSSISGLAYMHADLGGTLGNSDPELYIRWMQMGTFCPIMRTYGESTNIAPEPVLHNPNTQQIVRKTIDLRYQLLPYNYTLAWENSLLGKPLVRPLFYHYPEDPEVWALDDQYFWGKDILVAPIFEKGQIERRLYLPKGKWTELNTGLSRLGGQWIHVSVSKDHIPVFVRNGAFIPMAPSMQNTSQFDWRKMDIHFFPSISVNRSSSTIYIDDGISRQEVDKPMYHLIDLQGETKVNEMILQITGSGEGFGNKSESRQMTFVIHGVKSIPKRVLVYGKKVFLSMDESIINEQGPDVAYWDSKNHLLKVRLNWSGQAAFIDIRGRILNE